ncbi:hypothetical protein K438DRAFT_1789686 [Mycena galopus ATCC 62051]|nr:hypothetical protein K438DRAFT_1789686 [Mycena galopus ATCC 62051]
MLRAECHTQHIHPAGAAVIVGAGMCHASASMRPRARRNLPLATHTANCGSGACTARCHGACDGNSTKDRQCFYIWEGGHASMATHTFSAHCSPRFTRALLRSAMPNLLEPPIALLSQWVDHPVTKQRVTCTRWGRWGLVGVGLGVPLRAYVHAVRTVGGWCKRRWWWARMDCCCASKLWTGAYGEY